MSPGKKKTRPAKNSFFGRLFGGGKGQKQAGNGKAGRADKTRSAGKEGEAKARPLTPLERSIQEIKQMAAVGESDPQRLAMLLSNLLAGQQAQRQKDQQKFDAMVSGLVDKRESG